MRRRSWLVLLLLLAASPFGEQLAHAQEGESGIDGVVIDDATGETLLECAVQLVGGRRVYTDLDGRFSIDVRPGTYALRSFYDLYEPARIEGIVVRAGARTEVEIRLREEQNELEEVVVVARADRSSAATQLALRRQAAQASDAVSAQEIARSPDTTAADATRRIVGAQLQDGQYLFVRGLGGRYTNTLLNGVPLPSTDPDVPGVQLDLFPSGVLTSLTILKTSTPDLPGEGTGGTMVIATREYPTRFRLQLTASTGFNTETTFRDTLGYRGGGTDFLGFDDGTRALPSEARGLPLNARSSGRTQDEVDAVAARLGNVWDTPSYLVAPPIRLGFFVGDTVEVGGRRLGYLLTAGYQFATQRLLERIGQANAAGARDTFLTRTSITESSLLGGLGTLTFEVDERDELSLTVFGTASADDYVGRITGADSERGMSIDNRRLQFVQRQLALAQLAGDHRDLPGSARLHWSLAASLGARDEPDTRDFNADVQTRGTAWRPPAVRLFSELDQRELVGQGELTMPIGDLSLQIGGLLRVAERSFSLRRLTYQSGSGVDPTLPPEQLLSPEAVRGPTIRAVEMTENRDGYLSSQVTASSFVMLDGPVVDILRVIAGVRFEGFRQVLTPRSPFATTAADVAGVQRTNVDPLPSASLVLTVADQMFVRGGYSATVARPQPRELAAFQYPDFVRRRNISGNPDLRRTYVHNFDLRWEWFPGSTEVLAASVFTKLFASPIESVIIDQNRTTTFLNVEGATNVGAELEARIGLGRFASPLEAFELGANLSLVYSQVSFSLEQQELATSKSRPVAGQSPWVVNAWLSFSPPSTGLTVRLLYNAFGERIVDVGIGGQPDAYQQPLHTLDVAILWEVSPELSLRFTAQNCLPFDGAGQYRLTQGGVPILTYQTGTSLSLGLSITL